jgi:hypothetical protein
MARRDDMGTLRGLAGEHGYRLGRAPIHVSAPTTRLLEVSSYRRRTCHITRRRVSGAARIRLQHTTMEPGPVVRHRQNLTVKTA